jgi:nucleoside-diphosphate-sugar epimerase
VGDIVNVAFGREVSVVRIAELLARLTGRQDVPITRAEPRPGDVQRHYAGVDKAKRLFGFEATTDIETGLARTVEWFRENEIARRVGADAAGAPNW